jgi:hypothetical protein
MSTEPYRDCLEGLSVPFSRVRLSKTPCESVHRHKVVVIVGVAVLAGRVDPGWGDWHGLFVEVVVTPYFVFNNLHSVYHYPHSQAERRAPQDYPTADQGSDSR